MKAFLPRKLTEKLSALSLPLSGSLLQISGDDPTPYPQIVNLPQQHEYAIGIVIGAVGITLVIVLGIFMRRGKAR